MADVAASGVEVEVVVKKGGADGVAGWGMEGWEEGRRGVAGLLTMEGVLVGVEA